MFVQAFDPVLEHLKKEINKIQINWSKALGKEKIKLFDSKFLHLYYDRTRHWYYVDRPNAHGVVVIVPTFKKEGKEYVVFLMTQRPPLGRRNIIEFPAGLIGDVENGSEDIETAARRELLEETGLKVKKILKTTVADASASSPGLATEKGSVVYAECDYNQPLHQTLEADGGVIKKIVAIEKSQVKPWLEQKVLQGFTIDTSVFASLYTMPDELPMVIPDQWVMYDSDKENGNT
ncbi:MAG: NUDIX hydrolase [Vampirovibrio sp.]|nr:NUDIX hydrolase [Vampirovibrio sp.]